MTQHPNLPSILIKGTEGEVRSGIGGKNKFPIFFADFSIAIGTQLKINNFSCMYVCMYVALITKLCRCQSYTWPRDHVTQMVD